MMVSNRTLLFQGAPIFKGYVSFREGYPYELLPNEALSHAIETPGAEVVPKSEVVEGEQNRYIRYSNCRGGSNICKLMLGRAINWYTPEIYLTWIPKSAML